MIAFVFPSETFVGHESMAFRIIEVLQQSKKNIHCYVCHRNTRLIEKLNEIKVTVQIVRFYNSKLDLVLGFFNPGVLANIYSLRFVKSRHRHIVLVNGNAVANHGTTLAIAFYSWFYGIRSSMYVPMVHTASELGLNIIKSEFYCLSIKRSFKVISDVWTIDKEWGERVLNVDPAAKVHIVRNLVNSKNKNEKCYSKPGTGVELCFVGRVEKHQKGLDYLVDILEKIKINRKILVHIVGDGPDLEWLKKQTINSDFNSQLEFKFHGWISNPIEIVSNCDALIMPSRLEGVPLVAIEALMVGTTVFAFSIPGVRSLIGNEFLSRPFSVDEFAQKLNVYLMTSRAEPVTNCNIQDLLDPHRFECELNRAIKNI